MNTPLASRFAPDPAHVEALHAPSRLERLALWPQGPAAHAWVVVIHLGGCSVLAVALLSVLLVLEPWLR